MQTSTAASLNYGPQRRACVKFVDSQHYQRGAFEQGLRSLGFEIVPRPTSPRPGDLLVLWNRSFRDEREARAYEAKGADVLIVENPYLAPEAKPPTWFAISRNHHLGAGTWHVGEEARPIDWPVKPWREDGKHVLIIPQRGIGEPGVAMPRGWEYRAEASLQKITKRPIKLRKHPGVRPHPPMDGDFDDCWCAVTWASGGALKAICAGVPVFYEMPQWIGGPAAEPFVYGGVGAIESPFTGDRSWMLHRLSWAQWRLDEIEKGEPFRWLLSLS